MPPRSSPEVEVGTVWFVWGDHLRIIAERVNPYTQEREVHALPARIEAPTKQQRKAWPWAADWRIAKFGSRSLAFADS